MKKVKDTYKGGFFKNRHRLSWRAPFIVNALIETFNLTRTHTIIDAGCAIGDYVKEFEDCGYMAYGLEGSESAKPFFVSKHISVLDLRKPISEEHFGYSLAFSLEVAEHIEPQFSRVYVENLTKLSKTILITAAPPGQKGHGHVNCQLKGWWESEFKIFGYARCKELEQKFSEKLARVSHRKEINVYAKNVIVFKEV